MYYTAKAEILFFHFLFVGLKIVCTFAAEVEPERVFHPPADITARLFCAKKCVNPPFKLYLCFESAAL